MKQRLIVLWIAIVVMLTVVLPALPGVSSDGRLTGTPGGAVYADECPPVGHCG